MALWRTKTMITEHKAQIAEENNTAQKKGPLFLKTVDAF
jgi:hypothetical protein